MFLFKSATCEQCVFWALPDSDLQAQVRTMTSACPLLLNFDVAKLWSRLIRKRPRHPKLASRMWLWWAKMSPWLWNFAQMLLKQLADFTCKMPCWSLARFPGQVEHILLRPDTYVGSVEHQDWSFASFETFCVSWCMHCAFGQDESLWVWNEKKACSLYGAHVTFSTMLPEDAGWDGVQGHQLRACSLQSLWRDPCECCGQSPTRSENEGAVC